MRSAILEKAAADAKAPRLALPEATSEFRSQIGSGPTIQLPAGEAPTSRVLPSKSGKGSETQLSPQSVALPKNTTIPKELQPLAAEAKKYKSAEEFVKAQGTPVYHGSNAKFDTFDNSMQKNGWLGKGHYFTPDKNYAKEAGKNIKEVVLDSKNPFVVKGNSPSDVLSEIKQKFPEVDEFNIKEVLQKNGYDSLKFKHWDKGEMVSVFEPTQIKTKSQLTDLWNKVNKEPPTPGSIKPSTFSTVDEMFKAAPEAKAFIDGRARQVAEQTGNRFIQAPNKSVESVTRKLNEADIMGDWNRINDVARDTIVLDNPGSLSAVIESVTKGLKEGEFRTKTQNPADYMGYEGTVINVRTPGGLNGEIQVTKPKMVYGKLPRAEAEALLGKAEVARIEKEVGVPPGLGHEIYEQIRTLSPMDEAKLNALKQQSIDYYAKLR